MCTCTCDTLASKLRTSTSSSRCQQPAAILILNYFKPKDGLLDPKGPLSQSLSSRAIAAANSEVAKVIGGSAAKERGEYNK